MELTLVGTGHVFHIGPLIQRIIDERQPDIVCVELDPLRLKGLQEKRRLAEMESSGDPRAAEILEAHRQATKRLPLIYRFMARTQEKLATEQGVEAGSEMLAAVDAARSRAVPVATIDVDAQQLIRRAWKQMRFTEKVKFLWAIMRGQGSKTMEDEMTNYQEDPMAYLAEVGKEFPTLKRVLIDERDAHMAKALLDLPQHREKLAGNPETIRTVAIVGDGHVEGMLKILRATLSEDQIEVIRIGALRRGDLEASRFPSRSGTVVEGKEHGSVSFEVDVPAQEHYES